MNAICGSEYLERFIENSPPSDGFRQVSIYHSIRPVFQGGYNIPDTAQIQPGIGRINSLALVDKSTPSTLL
jgi:hypothetical protein